MNKENDILNELAAMGSSLASMSRAMPYELPDGYFETFGANIRRMAININLMPASENANFVRITTLPYEVAATYFHLLPEQMLAMAKRLDAADALPKEMPYKAPAGYFDQLAEQMLAAAREANTPDMNLPKTMPYTVPASYFEMLPGNMLAIAKASATPREKTIALKRAYILSQMRLGAAAILLLGLGFGFLRYFMQSAQPEAALANVPPTAIKEYVEQHIDDFDVDMIVNNLDAKSINAEASAIESAEATDVKAQTTNLKDEEIIQYLNETGWDNAKNNL